MMNFYDCMTVCRDRCTHPELFICPWIPKKLTLHSILETPHLIYYSPRARKQTTLWHQLASVMYIEPRTSNQYIPPCLRSVIQTCSISGHRLPLWIYEQVPDVSADAQSCVFLAAHFPLFFLVSGNTLRAWFGKRRVWCLSWCSKLAISHGIFGHGWVGLICRFWDKN